MSISIEQKSAKPIPPSPADSDETGALGAHTVTIETANSDSPRFAPNVPDTPLPGLTAAETALLQSLQDQVDAEEAEKANSNAPLIGLFESAVNFMGNPSEEGSSLIGLEDDASMNTEQKAAYVNKRLGNVGLEDSE